MQPPPSRVAATIRGLLSDAWPAHASDADTWLARHGVRPTRLVGDWTCWGTGIPGWGDATACWSRHGDLFVGVGWLLWGDEPDATRAGGELHDELTRALGDPVRRATAGDSTWHEWDCGGTVVELAIAEAGDPPVQVHVVDAAHTRDEEFGECRCSGSCCGGDPGPDRER